MINVCVNGEINGKKRDITIDIIKALGIIGMVMGHSGSPITKFIYLFHMAIFFIASGYCYNTKNTDSIDDVLKYIKKKFVSLWFPYVLWTAIYSLLHNFFITINVYTDNPLLLSYVEGQYVAITEPWTFTDVIKNIVKALFLQGRTQMGGAFWFLATLMEISLAYGFIDFILKQLLQKKHKLTIQTIISIILLILGYICSLKNYSFYGVNRVLSCYILFHGGFLLREFKVYGNERKVYVHFLAGLLSFIILYVCNGIGAVSVASNSYKNPVFFLVVSFIGWQFLYEMAFFMQLSSRIKKCMVIIGQNTMPVVILHFLCFKIVSYLGVLVKKDPLCLVAAFPVLYEGSGWWMAYLIVGLGVPVALGLLWKQVKIIFKNNLRVKM